MKQKFQIGDLVRIKGQCYNEYYYGYIVKRCGPELKDNFYIIKWIDESLKIWKYYYDFDLEKI